MKQEVHWWTWNSYSANLCLGSTFLCTINVLDTPAVHTESHTCMLMKWLLLKKKERKSLYAFMTSSIYCDDQDDLFHTHSGAKISKYTHRDLYSNLNTMSSLCTDHAFFMGTIVSYCTIISACFTIHR